MCNEISSRRWETDFWVGGSRRWRKYENVKIVSVTLTYKMRSKCKGHEISIGHIVYFVYLYLRLRFEDLVLVLVLRGPVLEKSLTVFFLPNCIIHLTDFDRHAPILSDLIVLA